MQVTRTAHCSFAVIINIAVILILDKNSNKNNRFSFLKYSNSNCLFGKFSFQGKMCSGELSFINLIDDIKEKVALKILEENDREDFRRAFTDVNSKAVSGDDATTSLSLLYTVMSKDEFDFKTEIVNIVMRGGTGVSAHASVVGGILGATIGYSQLPQEWLGELPQENIRLLNIKLNSLLDLFGLP